jgi:inner membrane protein
MTARTHDVIAFASLVTLAALYPPPSLNITTTFTCLVGCIIGALAPDLDQATNLLWDLLPEGHIFGHLFRNLFLQHRTLSHSLLGIWLFYLLLSFAVPRLFNPATVATQTVVSSLMIGILSHLCADFITKEGIPLLFPLPFKFGFPPFKALRITTGKFIEKFIIFPGATIYLLWFIVAKKDLLLHLIQLIRT